MIIGRMYNRQKKDANDGGKGTAKTTVHQSDGQSTAEKIAKEHGVSKATVERAAKAVETVELSP